MAGLETECPQKKHFGHEKVGSIGQKKKDGTNIPSRNFFLNNKVTWNTRSSNSLDVKDLSKDWTEYQDDQARHKAGKKYSIEIEGFFCRRSRIHPFTTKYNGRPDENEEKHRTTRKFLSVFMHCALTVTRIPLLFSPQHKS